MSLRFLRTLPLKTGLFTVAAAVRREEAEEREDRRRRDEWEREDRRRKEEEEREAKREARQRAERAEERAQMMEVLKLAFQARP